MRSENAIHCAMLPLTSSYLLDILGATEVRIPGCFQYHFFRVQDRETFYRSQKNGGEKKADQLHLELLRQRSNLKRLNSQLKARLRLIHSQKNVVNVCFCSEGFLLGQNFALSCFLISSRANKGIHNLLKSQ